ncbi:MAG: S-layer homology domain-containing protein [Cyanobacteria bacterium J06627_32]
MFSDIARHWARESIVALAKRSLISGYPNGTFRPNAVVSRAEYAALMMRAFSDLEAKRPAVAFEDVLPEYWARGAIDWATSRELFSGDESGRFLPQRSISRVQAIVVLVAALSADQMSEAVSGTEAQTVAQQLTARINETFIDAGEIPQYARDAVGIAIAQNLLETLPEPRKLEPRRAMTRGDVAALLCQALKLPSEERLQTFPGLDKPREDLFKAFFAQEAGFNADKLAFLDRGIQRSPYRNDIRQAAQRLQTSVAIPQQLNNAAPYPSRGNIPVIDLGGLDFLSPNILSGCMCIGTVEGGQLQTRWLGRDALTNRQMWSSTKFIPLLNVVDRANATAPLADVDRCRIRGEGSRSSRGHTFNELAAGIMSYDNRIATSNSLAAMFKHFNTPTGLEQWTRKLTGNRRLSFQGRYGEAPFIEYPELWDAKTRQVLVTSPGKHHRGENLVSTYDLTRLITMAGWHWRLPRQAIIPNAQGHSLESVLRAMGVDTARYVDIALETLGLSAAVRSPVILSKSGFGRSDQRDRTELTYCALVQFSLPRPGAWDPSASHQQYSFAMTLISAQRTGNAHQEARSVDALMTAEVTEIIRRLVTQQL